METVESSSPEETERLAARVAATLSPGDVVTVDGRARERQDDVRARRGPRARGDRAGDEPDVHDRPPLRGPGAGRPSRPLPLRRTWARTTGPTSSRTSTAPWRSSSGRRSGRESLPAPRVRVRLRHLGGAHRLIEVESRKLLQIGTFPMVILAFDTATDVATAALVRDGRGARGAAVARGPHPRRRRGAPGRGGPRAGRGRRRSRSGPGRAGTPACAWGS